MDADLAKKNYPIIIKAGLFLILWVIILWFYWPILVLLVNRLSASDDFNFALLIPFVSGYIVYLNRARVRSLLGTPSWWGLVLIFLGFSLYIFGKLASSLYMPAFSFLVVLTGTVFLLGGWPLVRLLSFPLLILVFVLPTESPLLAKITLPLQLISSTLATWFLQLIGIPVYRHGNVIDLGVRQLQVVKACSGLRYILPLSAMVLIFGYFFHRNLFKVVILLLSTIPAAIIANAIRVAGMGIFPELQKGFWHDFTGWLIFIFCLGCVFLVNAALNYVWKEPASTETNSNLSIEGSFKETNFSTIPYLLGAIIIVIVVGHFGLKKTEIKPMPLQKNLHSFPLELNGWQGKSLPVSAETLKVLGTEEYLDVNYYKPGHEEISLWIAFFADQSKASPHAPLTCLTGSGWKVLDSKTVEIGPGMPVSYLLIEMDGSQSVVYYWFIEQGQWVADIYGSKFSRGLTGFLKGRTDGAMIRLVTPAKQDIAAARARLDGFAKSVAPLLPQFLPGKGN
jgi:exosortase D (VPLPA-CTERM-specific)